VTLLIIGLVVFLGVHSVRIFADGWRARTIERIGLNAWKGGYSLLSLLGLALLVWGYAQARSDPLVLWLPPLWTRHLASLLVLVALALLAAAYLPGNRLKGWLHHPMLLGVMAWALAHLLANGNLADLLLFGAFLLWALLDHAAARARDRATRAVYPAGGNAMTALSILVGLAAWALFAFWAHQAWFGVSPLAG